MRNSETTLSLNNAPTARSTVIRTAGDPSKEEYHRKIPILLDEKLGSGIKKVPILFEEIISEMRKGRNDNFPVRNSEVVTLHSELVFAVSKHPPSITVFDGEADTR